MAIWVVVIGVKRFKSRGQSYNLVTPTEDQNSPCQLLGMENSNYIEMSDIVQMPNVE